MRPTRIRLLVALALLTGALAYLVVRVRYGSMPLIPAFAPATITFLAVAELWTASSVRSRLARRAGARPIEAMAVARLVALAKASAYAGSLALGGYAAVAAYTLTGLANPSKSHDAKVSGFGVLASAVLVVAALALERAGRVKEPPDGPGGPPDEPGDPFGEWRAGDHQRR